MNFVLKKTSVIMIIAKITIVTCKVAMFVIVVNAIITNNLIIIIIVIRIIAIPNIILQ